MPDPARPLLRQCALDILDVVFDQQILGARQLAVAGKGTEFDPVPGLVADPGGLDPGLETEKRKPGLDTVGIGSARERTRLQDISSLPARDFG